MLKILYLSLEDEKESLTPWNVHMCLVGPSEISEIVVVDLLCMPQVKVHRLLSKYPFQVSENS